MSKRSVLTLALVLVLSIAVIGIWVVRTFFYAPSEAINATYMEVHQEISTSEIHTIHIKSVNHNLVFQTSDSENVKITYFQKIDNSNIYSQDNGILYLEMIEQVEDLSSIFYQPTRKIDTIIISIPKEIPLRIINENYTGNFEIKGASVKSISNSTINGNIELSDVTVQNLTLTSNSGGIKLDHVSFTKAGITGVRGNIDIDLTDSLELYNLDVSTSFGTLMINDERVKEIYEEDGVQKEMFVNTIKKESDEAVASLTVSAVRNTISITSIEPVTVEDEVQEPAAGS